jgi:acetyl-CoA carboxylase biotin carboxyl carrier protein
MAIERIKELLALMKEHNLNEMEVSEGDFAVRLVKDSPSENKGQATVLVSHPGATHVIPGVAAAAAVPALGAEAAEAGDAASQGLLEITSPTVGTFYRSPSPEDESFVEEGTRIEIDHTICIIEAMKVMNEVKAEVSGVVRKILVENGQSVEYGQVLFLIDPAGE